MRMTGSVVLTNQRPVTITALAQRSIVSRHLWRVCRYFETFSYHPVSAKLLDASKSWLVSELSSQPMDSEMVPFMEESPRPRRASGELARVTLPLGQDYSTAPQSRKRPISRYLFLLLRAGTPSYTVPLYITKTKSGLLG